MVYEELRYPKVFGGKRGVEKSEEHLFGSNGVIKV
jgi:hypothetical protein